MGLEHLFSISNLDMMRSMSYFAIDLVIYLFSVVMILFSLPVCVSYSFVYMLLQILI